MTSNIGVKELSQFGKGLGFTTAAEIANEEDFKEGEAEVRRRIKEEYQKIIW